MSDKAYKLSLTLLSVFSAVVLIAGIVFSAIPSRDFEKTPVQTADITLTEAAEPPIVNIQAPETFDSLLLTIAALKNRYPDLLKLYKAGYSQNGRELFTITMGNGNEKALVIGGIHAREHITTKYLLKVIEDYCSAYYSENGYFGNYNVRELLNKYSIYIIPCTNPDGLEIINGNQTVKSGVRVSKISEYKANANGVDLNRNFPLAWESIDNGVNSPADFYFKGYQSGSEPETQALMNLCNSLDFKFMLSIHIKGNCIFWGDSYNTANNPLYKAFAADIAEPCSLYVAEPTEKAKSYGGGFENWFRHHFNRPGVCIELSSNENIIKPLGNENYLDFNKFVNYPLTANALAAAMASQNK